MPVGETKKATGGNRIVLPDILLTAANCSLLKNLVIRDVKIKTLFFTRCFYCIKLGSSNFGKLVVFFPFYVSFNVPVDFNRIKIFDCKDNAGLQNISKFFVINGAKGFH